jgi:hypothetical protein
MASSITMKTSEAMRELREMFAGLVMVPAIAATSPSPTVGPEIGEPSVPPGGVCSWEALGDQARSLMGELGMLQLEFQELLDALGAGDVVTDVPIRSAETIAQTTQKVAVDAAALLGAIKMASMSARDKPKV